MNESSLLREESSIGEPQLVAVKDDAEQGFEGEGGGANDQRSSDDVGEVRMSALMTRIWAGQQGKQNTSLLHLPHVFFP